MVVSQFEIAPLMMILSPTLNINKVNKEENTAFDSKIVSQVEDNSDDDNTEDISEEELPREVKNLAVDVASDHQPAVHNRVQLESSSCGRKRWQTVKFGF